MSFYINKWYSLVPVLLYAHDKLPDSNLKIIFNFTLNQRSAVRLGSYYASKFGTNCEASG